MTTDAQWDCKVCSRYHWGLSSTVQLTMLVSFNIRCYACWEVMILDSLRWDQAGIHRPGYHFATIAQSTYCSSCTCILVNGNWWWWCRILKGYCGTCVSSILHRAVPIHSVSHEHSDSTGLTQWRQMPTASTFAEWLSAEVDRLQFYYVMNQGHQLTHFILHPDCMYSSHWCMVLLCMCPLLLFLTVMWCQMSANSVLYASLLRCQQMHHRKAAG